MGRIFHLLSVFALLLVVTSACGSAVQEVNSDISGSSESARRTTDPRVSETPTPEATVGVSAAPTTEVTSPEDLPNFGARGEVSGGRGGSADDLLAVRHGVHENYERVVLDLGVGESPAEGAPKWSLSTAEGDGVARISLPSVSSTAVSDGALGDGTLTGFHVVRAPEGGVFVDVVSREAFTYRAFSLRDPARIVVDFKGSGNPPEMRSPKSGGKTVLFTPRPGERVSDPMTISGYSRNFEAGNEISLVDSSGREIASTNAQSNDWSETWGYFETSLDLPDGFQGPATLRVGTSSARDGKFEGVGEAVYVEGESG